MLVVINIHNNHIHIDIPFIFCFVQSTTLNGQYIASRRKRITPFKFMGISVNVYLSITFLYTRELTQKAISAKGFIAVVS